MDLLAMFRALVRNRLFTIPVIVLVIAGGVRVFFFTPSTYEATSSYVLFGAPGAPTASDIERNPALAKVNANNPYARIDLSVVGSIVVKRSGSDRSRQALLADGVDPRFVIMQGGMYGMTSPTVDVTGVGATAESAIRSTKLVGQRLKQELHDIQAVQRVDDAYMVTAVEVEAVQGARLRVSSQLRSLLGVVGIGIVLLWVAVSIGEAIRHLRAERTAVPSSFVLPSSASQKNHGETTNGRNGRHREPTRH